MNEGADHGWELAQVNFGRVKAALDHPDMAEFVANLDPVNALAESSPGFVWRLKGDGNDASGIQAFDDPAIIINMSVWTDMEALAAFAYRNAEHRTVMRRRREWFEHMELFMCLWWVPKGHRPTPAEARERLETLGRLGPSPASFTFKTPFPAPDAAPIKPILETCE